MCMCMQMSVYMYVCKHVRMCARARERLGVYGGGGGGSRCWFCISGVHKHSVAVALQYRRCM